MDASPELRLDSGIPLVKRGGRTFAVLKTVKVSLEMAVPASFPTFHSWMHDALPLLVATISKYLSASVSVSVTSCQLFLSSNERKNAALEVALLVLPESSGAEYERKVDEVVVAIHALHGSGS